MNTSGTCVMPRSAKRKARMLTDILDTTEQHTEDDEPSHLLGSSNQKAVPLKKSVSFSKTVIQLDFSLMQGERQLKGGKEGTPFKSTKAYQERQSKKKAATKAAKEQAFEEEANGKVQQLLDMAMQEDSNAAEELKKWGIDMETFILRIQHFVENFTGRKKYCLDFLVAIYRAYLLGRTTFEWNGFRQKLAGRFTMDPNHLYHVAVVELDGVVPMLPLTVASAFLILSDVFIKAHQFAASKGKPLSLENCLARVAEDDQYAFNAKMWFQIFDIDPIHAQLEMETDAGLDTYIPEQALGTNPPFLVPPTPAPASGLERTLERFIGATHTWQAEQHQAHLALTGQVQTNTADIKTNTTDIKTNTTDIKTTRSEVGQNRDRIQVLETQMSKLTKAPRKAPRKAAATVRKPAFVDPETGAKCPQCLATKVRGRCNKHLHA